MPPLGVRTQLSLLQPASHLSVRTKLAGHSDSFVSTALSSHHLINEEGLCCHSVLRPRDRSALPHPRHTDHPLPSLSWLPALERKRRVLVADPPSAPAGRAFSIRMSKDFCRRVGASGARSSILTFHDIPEHITAHLPLL